MGSSISAWWRRKISLTSRFSSSGTSPLMALVSSMQKNGHRSSPHWPADIVAQQAADDRAGAGRGGWMGAELMARAVAWHGPCEAKSLFMPDDLVMVVLVRLHQPVDMDHEIAHLGIVHRGLGLGAPGLLASAKLGYMPTKSSLERSLNSISPVRLQLAAEHKMQKLLWLRPWRLQRIVQRH